MLSFKDGLTNIANRRRFNASFEQEWENARSQPLSLLMIDIDYFKQYNDLYGHLRGDQCLVEVARTLSLALDGPRDLVARFGGEEFVVLLPGADTGMAWKVAERCQRRIDKQAIIHALAPHGIESSVLAWERWYRQKRASPRYLPRPSISNCMPPRETAATA